MAVVEIKGQNGGLVIVFGPGTFEEYTAELKNRFAVNPLLFKGFSVSFRGESLKRLSAEELASLQRLCLDHGMTLSLSHFSKNARDLRNKDVIIKRTLRSGQKIVHDGSVVILGNVHESAEVTAAKDIIVFGRLEGVVHAGCFGDLSSIVLALRLAPRQVRIGNMISRPPGDSVPNNQPELVYVEDGNICVREYNISRSNRVLV